MIFTIFFASHSEPILQPCGGALLPPAAHRGVPQHGVQPAPLPARYQAVRPGPQLAGDAARSAAAAAAGLLPPPGGAGPIYEPANQDHADHGGAAGPADQEGGQ